MPAMHIKTPLQTQNGFWRGVSVHKFMIQLRLHRQYSEKQGVENGASILLCLNQVVFQQSSPHSFTKTNGDYDFDQVEGNERKYTHRQSIYHTFYTNDYKIATIYSCILDGIRLENILLAILLISKYNLYTEQHSISLIYKGAFIYGYF